MGLAGTFGISGKWMDLKVGDCRIARLDMEIAKTHQDYFSKNGIPPCALLYNQLLSFHHLV